MLFSSSRRINQLEDDLREALSEVKSLRIEWDETYEKLLKLYRKTATERAKLEKLQTSSHEDPAPTTDQIEEGSNGAGSFLSPKQKLIQQQILQRRAHMR